ncbi:MAG: DUF6916 family protein [Gammaproteobacteria bacterium]
MTTYSIETFQNALQSECTLHPADGPALRAELVEVTSLHESEDAASRQFSVVWRGPATPALGQALYAIELPSGERPELFLVPLGKDREGMLYEAVFA